MPPIPNDRAILKWDLMIV